MKELIHELELMAQEDGHTPTDLRIVVKQRLNGNLSGHPLIVHSSKGVAMRIEREEEGRPLPTLWIAVPENWLKREP